MWNKMTAFMALALVDGAISLLAASLLLTPLEVEARGGGRGGGGRSAGSAIEISLIVTISIWIMWEQEPTGGDPQLGPRWLLGEPGTGRHPIRP